MDENISNIVVFESSSSDIYINNLSEISFNISLFTFIFVVYFLYVFLRDVFIRR